MDILFLTKQYFSSIGIVDVIDIGIVTFLTYKLILIIRETRAQQVVKGILLLIVLMQLAEIFKLNIINFILKNTMQIGLLAVLIVFQPELRRALEKVGTSRFSKFDFFSGDRMDTYSEIDYAIECVVSACSSMAKSKTGALIVLERDGHLSEIIETGTKLNADISPELIMNVFFPNSPLHDGAVIVRGDRVMAAGCLLPLSENQSLSRELGTRHRAALGMSERSDAITVVVSEETGTISAAVDGILKRHLALETLRKLLEREFKGNISDIEKMRNKIMAWKGREK